YALESRPLYNLESLTLHEAVPGHHLQISRARELGDLPNFRRYSYISAFGEGWGLYCEWLGLEMGFYTDPYSNFGRLTYEMWRAWPAHRRPRVPRRGPRQRRGAGQRARVERRRLDRQADEGGGEMKRAVFVLFAPLAAESPLVSSVGA